MKLTSKFKENEVFEKTLRNTYSEEVCNIVIEWIDEALRYVFKETDTRELFLLGRVDANTGEIEYSNEDYYLEEVLTRVMKEMQYAIDDEDNESREDIKEEFRILSEAL